jgi:hypothetical protein
MVEHIDGRQTIEHARPVVNKSARAREIVNRTGASML